jgi:hypothetical protein
LDTYLRQDKVMSISQLAKETYDVVKVWLHQNKKS